MLATNSFRQLEVWNKAHAIVLDVYRSTAGFPTDERYGLVSQMRRAAVSVPANIAEGYKRRGWRDKIRCYNIAESSLEELRYYFLLCGDLELAGDVLALEQKADVVAGMLSRLIHRIESSH